MKIKVKFWDCGGGDVCGIASIIVDVPAEIAEEDAYGYAEKTAEKEFEPYYLSGLYYDRVTSQKWDW